MTPEVEALMLCTAGFCLQPCRLLFYEDKTVWCESHGEHKGWFVGLNSSVVFEDKRWFVRFDGSSPLKRAQVKKGCVSGSGVLRRNEGFGRVLALTRNGDGQDEAQGTCLLVDEDLNTCLSFSTCGFS
ncbi:hypothetical protein F2Q69_00050192 [Brassica cretica]|uniref:Uncharacterized protein n=1 Tax=Brassica cretica TaxID=69181 RepID=A0A8S9PVP9_BRACR|nr:hypothetical protein F2Q69_00050192 [Brassica cretica]